MNLLTDFDAILFDADGVLFDAVEIHKHSFLIAIEGLGYHISDEEYDKVFNGLPTLSKLQILTHMYGLPEDEYKRIERVKQLNTSLLIDQYIQPNEELQNVLKQITIKKAICSNARKFTVQHMADCAKITKSMNLLLGNEDVIRVKPFPDIYLLAAKQLDVNINRCIIVEDSPKGLVAAISAGPKYLLKVKNPDDTIIQLRKLL